MIRSAWTVLVMLMVTPPLSLLVIVASFTTVDERFYDRIGRLWCRCALWASGVPIRAEGLEHVPRDRPVIIVSNHASWFDVLALAVLVPQRYRFVAKQELSRVPLWGRAWQACGHISVNRQDTQAAVKSLAAAGRLIRTDNSAVVIFPEGTRSATGELLPFKKGAFRLALSLGADLVPAAVIGSRDVLPRNGWRVRKRPIIVRFGFPVVVGNIGEDRLDDLIGRVRRDIEGMMRASTNPASEDHAGDHQHSRARDS
jgi:1-acyl-sn-glycerol-3-phosphate acyltransferase